MTPPPDKMFPLALMEEGAWRELAGAMYEAEFLVHGEIIQRTPHFMGKLMNSIQPDKPIVNFPNIVGRVGTPSPYAQPVEFGSKPHWPPIDPIIFWVRRKLAGKGSMMQLMAKDLARRSRRDFSNALSRGKIAGRRAATEGEIKERMIRSQAFLVARKISRVGTPGHHMFEQGFAASKDRAIELFIKARDKIIDRWSKL